MKRDTLNLKGKSLNTRNYIISKAQMAFAKFGFAKTTINDIAKLSEKGRRTIYVYFRDKTDLHNAVIDKEIKEVVLKIESQGIDKNLTHSEQLNRYSSLRNEQIWGLLDKYDSLKSDFLNKDTRVDKIRVALDKAENKILAQIFSRIISNNSLKVKITAELYLNILKSMEVKLATSKLSKDFHKEMNSINSIILNGIIN